jgi:PAS domain S-box-containing protein
MEESLEKEQQELNRIIDSSPIIIFYKDKDGKFIRVNQAFAEAQKISEEKFLGKTVFDFYSAEIARGMANDDLEVLESGQPRLGIIEQYESASGNRWVQTDKVPTFDKDGVT